MTRYWNFKWWGILAVVALAGLIRLHHLDHESLFMDEIHQVSYYQHGMVGLIADAAKQQQPLLDYWVRHWMAKLSYSDFAVRLPAALFGTAAVLLLILMINRVTSLPIALTAGTLVALLPYHIYFSQHARPYSIAIFFLLAVFYTLRIVLTEKISPAVTYLIFFAVTVCFLNTRALAPLIVVGSIVLICLLLLAFSYTRFWSFLSALRLRFLALAALGSAAILSYLPILSGILQSGHRYANQSESFGFATLTEGLTRFTFRPLSEAYITQLEPVGVVLLPFVVLSLWLTIRPHLIAKHIELLFYAGVLIIASVLHVVIFRGATSLPFRPPYAVYLLPLVITLAAIGIWAAIEAVPAGWRVSANRIAAVAGGVLVLFTAYHTIDFKSIRKVSDWRAVTEHLLSRNLRELVFVFDGLSQFGLWEPTFYGIPRYTNTRLRSTNVAAIPTQLDEIKRSELKPVFVLFHYRDYYLTSRSYYSFHARPPRDSAIDFSSMERDPALLVHKFVGFHVVEPKAVSGRLAEDLLHVLERLLADLPATSASVELHIAAAYLGQLLMLPRYERHAAKAIALAPIKKLAAVRTRLARLAHEPEQ